MSATHGDCKNDNRGKHKGYVCPTPDDGGSGGDGGGEVITVF